MYALQLMHELKCPSEEVMKVIQIYIDWVKRVEEEKGKMKEANEMMKDKLRKHFPVGKEKGGSPIDHEELWDILSQKEIQSCPFAEHWDLSSHDLDTCCFNKKFADNKQGASSSSERSSNNASYKRRYNEHSAPNVNSVPPVMNMGWGGQMQSMPMGAPMMQQQPPAQGPFMFQPYGDNRTICGYPNPNGGVCQQTGHRAANCFFNPNRQQRNNFSNQNQGGGNGVGGNQVTLTSNTRVRESKFKASEKKEANEEKPASDLNALPRDSHSHREWFSLNVSSVNSLPSSSFSSSERVPLLRKLGSSSTELRAETHQLPSLLSAQRHSERKEKESREDDSEREPSLFDIYASEDGNPSVEEEEETSMNEESEADHMPASSAIHTEACAFAPSSNIPLPPLLRFGGSLTRMMQRKFSGRKGKKVYSDERLMKLACKHCHTRGHTIDICINRAAEMSGEDTAGAWVQALIDRSPFHLERLTDGRSWEEIEIIIEREGAVFNAGNPWLKSELRRDRLRKNLGYWYVIGANPTVLSWLGFGVPLRFLTEPEAYAFQNHTKSIEGHEDFVRQEHTMHEKDGSFVRMTAETSRVGAVRIINPIMVSVNKKNKPRMCHDMRWPNGYLPHVDFRMETLQRELADVVAEGDVLLSIDLAKAYYSVPLHPDAQAYLCWVWDGKTYKPTVLVFGVSPAPHVFTKIMRPWMQLCRSSLVKLMGMIDDYLFSVQPSRALALARFARFSLQRLGWELNDKCQLVPQPRLCILGMIVDAAKMIVEAPVEKVKEARQLIERILNTSWRCQYVDVSLFQQVCGKLQSMALALPGVRVFTRALYVLIARAVDETRVPRFKIHPNEYVDSIDELLFWRERLCAEFNGLPIHVRDAGVKIWVDASDIGWGGEVLGKQYAGELPLREVGHSSTRRELMALLLLAREAQADIQHQRVHILMDSAPAICNLIAGGGSKENLVQAVKEWFHFCERHSIIATYEWIPRELNTVADRYSKLAATQYEMCDGVENFIRTWLRSQPLDSERAATIPLFIPNFNVIPLRLESILMNMSEAVMLTPQWTSQSWWPTLIKHRLSSIYLGGIARVLKPTVDTGSTWNRQWKMEAHWIRGRRKIHKKE